MEKTGAGEAYIRLINRAQGAGDVKEGERRADSQEIDECRTDRYPYRCDAANMRAADYKGGLRMLNDALKDPSREYRCEALRASSRFADKAFIHLSHQGALQNETGITDR